MSETFFGDNIEFNYNKHNKYIVPNQEYEQSQRLNYFNSLPSPIPQSVSNESCDNAVSLKDFSKNKKWYETNEYENPDLNSLCEIFDFYTQENSEDFEQRFLKKKRNQKDQINSNDNEIIKKEETKKQPGPIILEGNDKVNNNDNTKINKKITYFVTFHENTKDNDSEIDLIFLREDNKIIKIRTYIFGSFKKYINNLLEIRYKKWCIRNKNKKRELDKLCDLDPESINENNKIEDNIKLWDMSLEKIYKKTKISSKANKPYDNNIEIINSIYDKKQNENDKEVKELRLAFKLTFGELHQIFIKDQIEISSELKEKIKDSKIFDSKFFNNLKDFYEYLEIQFCDKDKKFLEKYIYQPIVGIEALCLDFYNWFAKKL